MEIFAAQDALDRAGFALGGPEGMAASAREDLITDLRTLACMTAALIASLGEAQAAPGPATPSPAAATGPAAVTGPQRNRRRGGSPR